LTSTNPFTPNKLNTNEKLFLRFPSVIGFRKSRVIPSFNTIIKLNSKCKREEHYNEEFSTLDHLKYGRLFHIGTKKAFISIVSMKLIVEITRCQPASCSAILCRIGGRKSF
jgi:hypothetical protein